eukprot:30888-Pelagococcus_subviridis.AAC.3
MLKSGVLGCKERRRKSLRNDVQRAREDVWKAVSPTPPVISGSSAGRDVGRNPNAAFHSLGPALIGASKCAGTIVSNFHLPMRLAQSATSSGTFSYTSVDTTGATMRRFTIPTHDISGSNKFEGPKYNAWSALRCHPRRFRSFSVMSFDDVVRVFALVLMSKRFRNFSAAMVKLSSSPDSSKSRSGIASGTFSDTYTTASVTSKVLVALCRNAHSVNATYDATPSAGGVRSSHSNSSAHDGASPFASTPPPNPSVPVKKRWRRHSLRNGVVRANGVVREAVSPVLNMPKNVGGRFTGHDH